MTTNSTTAEDLLDDYRSMPLTRRFEERVNYRSMPLIRRFEERASQLYGTGPIGGFCHLYIGQKADPFARREPQ
jgi:TPP-dependent pyruvate/acetoin dehydrogenase alpha subunit